MQEVSPESPEARARRGDWASRLEHARRRLSRGGRAYEVAKRVAIGVYSDGFIHAGNLAYLAIFALFPFFIILAALASFFGQTPDTLRALDSFLRTLPPDIAAWLRGPIESVLAERTGALLWLGALVGLWTVGSFIETIRDILRRAYGTTYSRAFWHYRLSSIGLIVGSVILMLVAFSAQVALTAAEQFVYRLLPFARGWATWIGISRLAPFGLLVGALYILFYGLTPSKYRYNGSPKWPGAVLTAGWWLGTTMALPRVLELFGGYGRTYGGLAGTVVALFFFWIVGFGLVIGAQLNAALADGPETGVREPAPTG